MKTFRHACLALVIATGLGVAATAGAQTVGYNIRTGDVWVDSRLGEINDYGQRYRDPFVGEMTGYYGAPRSLIVELLERRRWAPADVYYACALAHSMRIPCGDVVREYDRHPGQGWGAVAKRYGIKPGSKAFHALKRGTVSTYDRWGYPVVLDRPVRVDWSKHGPGKSNGHGNSNGKHKPAPQAGNGHGSSGHDSHGKSGKAAPGNSGKGKSDDKGKSDGKDKGKGNGR